MKLSLTTGCHGGSHTTLTCIVTMRSSVIKLWLQAKVQYNVSSHVPIR